MGVPLHELNLSCWPSAAGGRWGVPMGPALQHSVDCAYAFKDFVDRLTEMGETKSSRERAANPSGPARVRPRPVLF
jgi:hypothetical protein